MIIRKALLSDVLAIQELVNYYANQDRMLPKSLSVLYENIRDFFVAADDDGTLLGCAAASVCWDDLAEIKSLAVREDKQKLGIGASLVKTCIEDLNKLGVNKIISLTYSVEFFKKLGFNIIDKKKLPQKIWTECVYCPKFPDCGEEAMMREI